jgi:predicted  nucleic acid-binding Zn-ribbon protein
MDSADRRDLILEAARDAVPISLLTESVDDFLTLGLASALRATLGSQEDERLATLKACSSRLKEGWALLEQYKREMTGQHKAECFQALKDAQERLDGSWQEWKSWQSEQYQRRLEHRREKRQEFEGKVRGTIANLNERRQRLYGVLAHKEAHLTELYDRLASARTDEFRARVEGWIDQEQESISDIKNKLEQIERWIDDEKEKLR